MNILTRKKASATGNHRLGEGSKKGLVFIPDISGFTELVRSTDMVTGKAITYQLLSAIISQNKLDLEIAEIEGDAVLFFKWQAIPDVDELKQQFKLMKNAFDKAKAKLEIQYCLSLTLELKAIAHYGMMTRFCLGGFTKLYGEVIIEAHRLLKNNVPECSYLLITDELYAASVSAAATVSKSIHLPNRMCGIYQGLRNICYTYTSFGSSIEWVV